ncbi:MAG: PilZ domain-containing protein [Peptococcaceae bacterium]|jgi:c-di-GMP-binding flagellar brake protein YcgR|nr:PilZ domain-containing protein [Peptococcaceae bacterium]
MLKARVYDINKRFVCEGQAEYKKDEKVVYVKATENIEKRGPGFLVQFMDDNQGVLDFRCGYIGFMREGLLYNNALEVVEIVSKIQRRQDLKAKTNIPVKIILLEEDDKVMIDPVTMKSMQFQAYLRDISAGGVMLETEAALEVNQKFLFPFDKGSTPILVTARVIREQPQEGKLRCYGCKYLNNNSGKESVIREYVFRLQLASKYTARDK